MYILVANLHTQADQRLFAPCIDGTFQYLRGDHPVHRH